MTTKISVFAWLAGSCMVASAAMGTSAPLIMNWGALDSSGAEQQAAFRLLKSSTAAPLVQRPTARGTAPWLVRFNDPIREEWKADLETAGGAIHGYVPENALLVEATPAAIVRIASLDAVAWVGEYLPAYKKSQAGPEAAAESREYAVALFRADDKPRLAREFGEMNVFVPREDMEADHEGFRVRLSPKQVDEVANWSEVEWIAPHEPSRFWGSSGPEGSAAAGESIPALQAAFDEGTRIRLLGRGAADAGRYGAESRAVDRFVWAHPEMLVVAAAGNAAVDLNPADGIVDAGSVGTPATAKNVLAVGAAEGRRDVARTWVESWPEDFAVEPIARDRMAQADGPQGLAAFSGRGPCADGRIKPDLVAPGTFLVAPRPADSDLTGWGAAENANEIFVGGTGVAAEQVVEAARQARRWLVEPRGFEAPSAALVKALLLAGARDLAPGQYGTGAKQEIPFGRPNSAQGAGLLDLANALEANEGESLELHDSPGLATGAADVYEWTVEQPGGRFILVLAYADAPAAPCAGRQLVNDLDLTVTAPDGAVRHPNGRQRPDDLNNVEMIEFEADEAGVYLARVEARAVPMGGSQPYALVVRGPRAPAASAAPSETK